MSGRHHQGPPAQAEAISAINPLHNLAEVLESGANEIHLDEAVRQKALKSTQRMLDFARSRQVTVPSAGNA